ncbi:hypothetical protein JZ751_014499 [Albula glossodonta]|uniref:Rho guanine nucleotide exchange factor 3 n=1 Tax=Albula glossodonta TaxID=121402 RepID=A0A8T2N1W4_9TELE|nr:hypothetical protein JZ751_014499 [Albula glossodonta]
MTHTYSEVGNCGFRKLVISQPRLCAELSDAEKEKLQAAAGGSAVLSDIHTGNAETPHRNRPLPRPLPLIFHICPLLPSAGRYTYCPTSLAFILTHKQALLYKDNHERSGQTEADRQAERFQCPVLLDESASLPAMLSSTLVSTRCSSNGALAGHIHAALDDAKLSIAASHHPTEQEGSGYGEELKAQQDEDDSVGSLETSKDVESFTFCLILCLPEPSNKRVKPVGKGAGLSGFMGPVKTPALKRLGQSIQRSISFRTEAQPLPMAPIRTRQKASSFPRRRNSQLWSDTVDSLSQELSAKEIKRQEVIYELTQGERQLIEDLSLVKKVYYEPMLKLDILTESELGQIFGTLDSLIPLHEGPYSLIPIHEGRALLSSPYMKGPTRSSPYMKVGPYSLIPIHEGRALLSSPYMKVGPYSLIPLHEDLLSRLESLRGAEKTVEEVGPTMLDWSVNVTLQHLSLKGERTWPYSLSTLLGRFLHMLIFCENDLKASWLEAYITYCCNQVGAKALLDQKKQDRRVEHFLRLCQESSFSRKLDLWNFLDLPRSRLVKYPLLLREIEKSTPLEHPDRDSLPQALDLIQKIVSEVNSKTGEAECQFYRRGLCYQEEGQRLPEIQLSRFLHCHGELKNSKGQKLHVFLFELALVLTRPVAQDRDGQVQFQVYRQPLPAAHLLLEDLPDGEGGGGGSFRGAFSSANDKAKNCFRVSSTGRAKAQSHSLQANDSFNKQQWITCLRQAMIQSRDMESHTSQPRPSTPAAPDPALYHIAELSLCSDAEMMDT